MQRRIWAFLGIGILAFSLSCTVWLLWSRNLILPEARVELIRWGDGVRVIWTAEEPGTVLWVKGTGNYPRHHPPSTSGESYDFPGPALIPDRFIVCTRIGNSVRYEIHSLHE